jgi:hypothetical protein
VGEFYETKKVKPAAPCNVIAEFPYKGYRIVQTDDREWIGYNSVEGAPVMPNVFVVVDDFDEPALPIGMQSYYTLHDAYAAIDIKEEYFPLVSGATWPTTLLHEYRVYQSYRRNFHHVMVALASIKKTCQDAKDFDDNPGEDVLRRLHLLNQVIVEGHTPITRT